MARWRKLGIVAGGGQAPVALAEHCAATGQAYWVSRIAPFADPALDAHPGASFNIGKMGARLAALAAENVDAVTMVGAVPRPDFAAVEFDEHGLSMLPKLAAAARHGDDALLRVLIDELEDAGYLVVGADDALSELRAPAGALGAHAPSARNREDMIKAARLAAALGPFDAGQAVCVCDGLVLAIEAQEGTDAMLARVAGLPVEVRGTTQARRGVLMKRPKSIQDRRIDLPTIGARTIERAAEAGLAGVAIEAGGAMILARASVIERADALGLFVYGFRPDEVDAP